MTENNAAPYVVWSRRRATAGCGSGCVRCVASKKSPHKCGQKYWKQCEQCRTEYLSDLLNYSVMRKIIFLI
ncbi:hypothetical protein CI616_27725 [Klebsiella pneumoniae subsp. pneumoniae]|nr:hypothetical protein BIT31_04495 [Klebsiella pneumoniae]OXU65987.1 hypothetical protein CEB48_05815 [Klebsiella pneumoniae subsp. pneumoniae]OSY23545.1 hypothetical protein B6V83_26190 [Klebsiella pneumoniae]OVX85033.1 hypothetical protein BME22_04330 [Klebsiella pneumoniae]OXS98494.1 hypothetical protein B6R99_16645 [Klebsiella pneumoniae]